jgi:hypothetical protein
LTLFIEEAARMERSMKFWRKPDASDTARLSASGQCWRMKKCG